MTEFFGVKYHYEFEQGSADWMRARKGVITASNVKHILTPTLKVAANDKTRAYVYQLVSDRVTDFIEEGFESWDMRRGKEDEIYARELYKKTYGDLKECGFIANTVSGVKLGFSPDGVAFSEKSGVEFKSRKSNLAIKDTMEFLYKGEVPKDDVLQVQFGLLVSGWEWIDYGIYSGGLNMVKLRVYPDATIHEAIIDAVLSTEEKVEENMGRYLKFTADFPKTKYRPFTDDGGFHVGDKNEN